VSGRPAPPTRLPRFQRAHAAFLEWRLVPAPQRGELVRLLGEELRVHKRALGRLVSIEAGKIESEGLGEVQEMIDICDYAVGLSRQLYGLTIATERHEHRMAETWHPLGVTGIISAFNFPVAVWSWNAALALVCGNSIVWKPSEKTPLTAFGDASAVRASPEAFQGRRWRCAGGVVRGAGRRSRESARRWSITPRFPWSRQPARPQWDAPSAPKLAQRFARAILELGGNNAAVVTPTADLDLTLRGVAFAAMGTAGQRCTTLRRLFVHESVFDRFVPRLKKAYESVSVGNPLAGSLVGPLIDGFAYESMQRALAEAKAAGGAIVGGGRVAVEGAEDAFYVRPALVEIGGQSELVEQETFAPILYVMKYGDFDAVLELHNAVPQGLSSSIFTNDLREAEAFLSARGSDCGIANVNIGPSGAEIGGAFGGEKETGGGRESGSDAWKAYMRRATNTINYGRTLPLAQASSST